MKYEIEIHIFSEKLNRIMLEKGLVNKKGKADPIKLYNLLYPNDEITDDMFKLDGQKYRDKTHNILNWIQGKNYPKSIKDILSLCNALECDLDYFFTDMECPTHDIQFIHDYIGISKEAINELHRLTTFPAGGSRLAIIDYLLCNTDFSTVLTEKIIDYYKKYNRFESGKKKYFEEGKILKDLVGDNILKQIELQASGKFTPTIDRHKLADLDSSKEASRFRIQKSFDKILDGIDECLYKKNNPENENL